MISVILPCYNHFDFLEKRLFSIFNQTLQDFELIILDDCSDDGSWDILKNYKNHPKVSFCIQNEYNSGSPFKQWEKGISLAKFDWIWIAESDDFSDLYFLEKLSLLIDDNVSLVFSKSRFIDAEGCELEIQDVYNEISNFLTSSKYVSFNSSFFLERFLLYKNLILNASSVIFRKPSFFPKAILEMKFSGDWYFWIFLLKNDSLIKFYLEPLNHFRFHIGSTRELKIFSEEKERFKEIIDCVLFCKSVLKINSINYIFDSKFDEVLNWRIKTFSKFGRFRFSFLFPPIPFFLYYRYYSLLLKLI